MTNIGIEKFYLKFCEYYEFLYDNYDRVAGYSEAVDAFDEFLPDNREFVSEFCKYRQDLITSLDQIIVRVAHGFPFLFQLTKTLYHVSRAYVKKFFMDEWKTKSRVLPRGRYEPQPHENPRRSYRARIVRPRSGSEVRLPWPHKSAGSWSST